MCNIRIFDNKIKHTFYYWIFPDLTQPEITNCPADVSVYLERNSNIAEATWIPPSATDSYRWRNKCSTDGSRAEFNVSH